MENECAPHSGVSNPCYARFLNSQFSIPQFFHYFDRLQISTVFLGFRFLIDRSMWKLLRATTQ